MENIPGAIPSSHHGGAYLVHAHAHGTGLSLHLLALWTVRRCLLRGAVRFFSYFSYHFNNKIHTNNICI